MDIILCIYMIFLSALHYSESYINLGELKCATTLGQLDADCPVNEICKGYCKDACSKTNSNIFGSGIYSDFSPICKSAAHDFRISLWNSSERTVLLKRSSSTNFTFYGSFRNRISSLSISIPMAKLSSYEFLNPHVSENIIDVISMHKNYLFEEDEKHTQECLVPPNWKLEFQLYNGKFNGQQVSTATNPGFKRMKVNWPGQTGNVLVENKYLGLNAGFQCIPVDNRLSILTSLAFRKDAYFIPNYLTLTVNVNETVTLSMSETEVNGGKETIWKKDGRKLEEICIVPQNVSHTSITLTNTEIGLSGIYSLEYKESNISRRGYVRLIVRACPEGKFGTFCDKECSTCLNGGLCHEITGTCICAPGFNGSYCEDACEFGFVGRKCSVKCNMDSQSDDRICKGLLICLPDPYGCSCAAGFSGIFCNETCLPGTYGASCLQHRICHCAHGKGCDINSGVCAKGNCAKGWHGKSCNESTMNVDKLSYDLISPTAVNLTWEPPIKLFSPVKHYIVTFEQVRRKTLCHIPEHELTTSQEMVTSTKTVTSTSILLENLMPFSYYTISVSAFTVSVGPLLEITVETPATAPPPPSKFHVSYKTSSVLFLSWNDPYPPNGLIDSFEVCYWQTQNIHHTKNFQKYSETACSNQSNLNCFVLKNLMRNQEYEIQLRAFNANISESSEPVSIEARTPISEAEANLNVLISQQKDQQVVLLIYPSHYDVLRESTAITRSYFVIVDSTDKNHAVSDIDQYINIKSKCFFSNADTYIAGILPSIPIYGINFTIGNDSCLNGYFNPSLKHKTYRFGLLPIVSGCKEIVYGSIVYTNKINIKSPNTNGASASSASDKSFKIVLALLLPLTIILLVGVLYMYLQKPNTFDSLISKKRFFPAKTDNDFSACNDGLVDFDNIETESINEDLSNCMPVKELLDYVKQNGKNNKIRKEFMSLPKGQMYPCFTAKLADNKFKNRYGNILPYDHSRVILKENGDSQYIHANYVDGYNKARKYIATQGPMSLTMTDFWFMVWQEKVSKIIMITNLEENGKIKCEKYWPDEESSYGYIDVSFKCSEYYADFVIRTFSLSKDHKSREVKQFHFTSWPDHGIPLNTTPFLNFLNKVQVNANSDEPIIVHCSAGIGRTGAVILFENSFNMGAQGDKIDTLGQLCSMRKQRMNIVETYEQYMYILYALVEALCVEKTCMCPMTFLKEYDQMLIPDNGTGINTIEKQFQMLKDLPLQPLQTDILAAYMVNNQPKNRSMHILPTERARPILPRQTNGTDYINAVYIDGYRSKNKFVATQYPLPETATDFWRMVFELKSKIVVLLQDIPLDNSKNPQLWSSDGVQIFDMIEVECDSVDEENDVVISNLRIKHKEVMFELPVKIIQIKYWAVDENLPPDTSELLSAMKCVQHSDNEFANHTIITICLDGATACGIFCSFLYIIERMKIEKEIDIFQTTKCIRTNRPQFIPNMEQYRFLFALTKSYLESVE